MNATIIILSLLATPVLCYVAYRCGYGWNTVNVMDPFTVTTFGQKNPDLHVYPDMDLRPGGVTYYDAYKKNQQYMDIAKAMCTVL